MLLGKKLEKGDTIGLIAPSGAVRTEGAIEKAIAETERMGYRVKVGESCGKVYGYLSGTDEVRARDINTMFADKDVDAVIHLMPSDATYVFTQAQSKRANMVPISKVSVLKFIRPMLKSLSVRVLHTPASAQQRS